jgi:hypothetical protein
MAIQSATVVLSSAELLALTETPITIIPPTGAGTYVNLISVTMEYVFVSTPYTIADPSDIFALAPQGNPSDTMISLLQTGLVDQSVSMVGGLSAILQSLNANDAPLPVSQLSNKAIQVTSSTDVADGDGTLVVTAYYTVETAI